MNVYTPSRYDERVTHLALGIEPRSAIAGSRLGGGVDIRWERYPSPVAQWRRWRPGDTLTAVLPRLDRHPSGRFARRYDQPIATAMDVRVVDDDHRGRVRVPGRGRRIVPRRLRITIADEQTVLDAEADPTTPPHAAWRRMFPVACFPGSAAALGSGATTLRGTIRRDRGDGTLVPVRWARVRADAITGSEIGWAHGDDRGEFVLVLPAADAVNFPADPMLVRLTVGAELPAPTAHPTDPLLHEVDPLWDLPLEPVVASPDPENEPTLNGRRFLAEHTQLSPISPLTPIPLHHGRQTSVVIQIT